MLLKCRLTRTAASNRQTWCAILEFFSTTHCQWPTTSPRSPKFFFFHLRRIRQIKRCLNEKSYGFWFKHKSYSDLTTATPFWSTYQTPHFIHTPLSSTVLHDSSKAWSQGITSPQLVHILWRRFINIGVQNCRFNSKNTWLSNLFPMI